MPLLLVFCSYSSTAQPDTTDACPTGTVGLCDPSVISIITEDVVVTETTKPGGIEIVTETTTTTSTTTIANQDSGDILDPSNGFVPNSKSGNSEVDWGGVGSAINSTNCGTINNGKCAGLTSSNLTTYRQTVNVGSLSMENRGGRMNYSLEIDVSDPSDTAYFKLITAENTYTNVLSAAGSTTYGTLSGGFDFADNITSVYIEFGGVNHNISTTYPLIDTITLNIFWNTVSTIITNHITTLTEFIALDFGDGANDIAIDLFEQNDVVPLPTGEIEFKPIEGPGTENEVTIETIEDDLNASMEVASLDIKPPAMDTEEPINELSETSIEAEILEPQNEPSSSSSTGVSKGKEKEDKVKAVKPKKSKDLQKAGSKLVKKIGDKAIYDSSNQTRMLLVMNVLSPSKGFFTNQTQLPEMTGFFNNNSIPSGVLQDNNIAAYLLQLDSSQKMDQLILSQYK